ncbi:hypothetical protein EMIT0P74_80354 [Pseudomonas sp. IT-P74]
MAKTTGYQRRWAGWAKGLVLYYLMDEIDTVGASLLAKNVNDNAGNLTVRGALTLIASKLAPTSSEARNAKTNAPHRRGAVYRAT